MRSLTVAALVVITAGCAVKAPAQAVAKLAVPTTEAECVSHGGEWIFAGPQNVVKYCFLRTTDGGKACKTSAQCQSECVEQQGGNVCAETYSGCFQPTGRGTVTQCVN